MANSNLTKLLTEGIKSSQLLLIHTNNDDYPLADFILQQIKPDGYHKQYFTAERNFDFSVIEDILKTVSLFEQSNYIQINFKTKPNIEQQKQIIKLITNLNETNILVILCDKLTKTEQNSSWFKAVASNGITLGVNNLDAEILISYLFKKHNLSITGDAIHTLINQNQGNMAQLLNEASKLILAIPHGSIIGANEVAQLTSDNAQYNIYQLSSSYLAGDLAKSIKILDNLYQESGDAILIMWVLQEDIKRLLKIKSKLKTGANIGQVMQQMRLWGESINKLPIANKRLSYKSLIEIYQLLARLDMSIKGVLNLDIRLLLTNIIKHICVA